MITFYDEQPAMFSCAIVACILYYNSLRNRSSLRRKAVLPPSQSPWAYLCPNADDSSFLHLTGMLRRDFEKMKDILFDEERDRPSSLVSYLALVPRLLLLSCSSLRASLLILYLSSTESCFHVVFRVFRL